MLAKLTVGEMTVEYRAQYRCFGVLYCFIGYPGAPNEKKYEKYLECSFPLSDIVLWPFRGIFVRAKII